jgi:hypothetical protein
VNEYGSDPLDLPPIWQEAASTSPVAVAAGILLVIASFILLMVSPALIIAVWRWAL